jgi:hypothetical protein
MPDSNLKTYIVILNYNGSQDTLECLESVYKADDSNLQVIVVDNASQDNSMAQLQAWAEGRPNPPTFIQTGFNCGFAAGNNAGIRYALSQTDCGYIWLLNNDTLISPDCLKVAAAFFNRVPDAALLGPKILDMANAWWQWPMAQSLTLGSILCALSPLRRLFTGTRLYRNYFYRGEEPQQVYAIQGSSMLFRKEALEQIGLLDEATFLFWEEYIVAERLKERNLNTYLVPQMVIRHKYNRSVSKLGAGMFIESFKSERYFFVNYLCLSKAKRGLLLLVRVLAYSFRMFSDGSYRKNFIDFLKVLFDNITTMSTNRILK